MNENKDYLDLKNGLDNALAAGDVESAKSFWDKIKDLLEGTPLPGTGTVCPTRPEDNE